MYRAGKFLWRARQVRVHNGQPEFYLDGVWYPHGSAHGVTIHAPKGWQPTPDTIPEGTFVKTPDGVNRACATCIGWNTNFPRKHTTHCMHCKSRRDGMMNRYWCPKTPMTGERRTAVIFDEFAEKPEAKHEFQVGAWVWRTKLGHCCFGHPRQVTAVDAPDTVIIKCVCGQEWPLSGTKYARKIAVGDKILIVDTPKTGGLPGSIKGMILSLGDKHIYMDEFNGRNWSARYEDIRLAE